MMTFYETPTGLRMRYLAASEFICDTYLSGRPGARKRLLHDGREVEAEFLMVYHHGPNDGSTSSCLLIGKNCNTQTLDDIDLPEDVSIVGYANAVKVFELLEWFKRNTGDP